MLKSISRPGRIPSNLFLVCHTGAQVLDELESRALKLSAKQFPGLGKLADGGAQMPPCTSVKHLGPALLRALAAGQPDAGTGKTVFAHVDCCPQCRQLCAAQPLPDTVPYTPSPANTAGGAALRLAPPAGDAAACAPVMHALCGCYAMKITNAILEAYLDCKTKGYLKLLGEAGIQVRLRGDDRGGESRHVAGRRPLAKLVFPGFGEGDACRGMHLTATTLKKGASMLVDAVLEDESISIRFDALKQRPTNPRRSR